MTEFTETTTCVRSASHGVGVGALSQALGIIEGPGLAAAP